MISKREWYAALRRMLKRAALVFGGLFLMAAFFSTGACLISGLRRRCSLRCPRRRRDTGWHDGMELLSRLLAQGGVEIAGGSRREAEKLLGR